jgi:anti-sigma regulatory factor (Ser/Thr protein kinase)
MQRTDSKSGRAGELTRGAAARTGHPAAACEPSSPLSQHGEVLQLTLEAEPMVLAGLRHTVARWLAFHGIAEQDRFDITLATSEAAGNSIEHAYRAHKATLTVTCERESAGEPDSAAVRICIRDNGRWRDGGPYGRGRGLAIMRALVDSVEIQRREQGTTVVLTKRCAREAGSGADP